MFAYDENDKLYEYEEGDFLAVCGCCHKLYYRSMSEQFSGLWERKYDNCPYCGFKNSSSFFWQYFNYAIGKDEMKMLKEESLFDTVVIYCHQQYLLSRCEGCDHYSGCPGIPCGNCKQCMEEVHYPDRYMYGRKDYECERMVYFYVCDYASKYASEMLHLMRKSDALKENNEYRVLSIGCGACPDLMALERYCHECSQTKTISYLGIDVNERWRCIHEKIDTYRTSTVRNTQFRYWDVVTKDFTIPDANVIVLQYVISHFYNTGQIGQINAFFQKLVDVIVSRKQKGVPMVILINDVNSVNRGRDYFEGLVDKIEVAGFHVRCKMYYFDYNVKNPAQRYGEKHPSCRTIFDFPSVFDDIYQSWRVCSSAQLLIEVQ